MTLKNLIKERALFFPDTHRPSWWLFDFRPLLMDGFFCHQIAKIFWKRYCHESDVQLAAVELAGVPLMTALIYEGHLQKIRVNGLIIRKSKKKFGLSATIVGNIRLNIKTIVVDDLSGTGKSFEKAISVLLDHQVEVDEVFSILNLRKKSNEALLLKYQLVSNHIFSLSDFNLVSDTEN